MSYRQTIHHNWPMRHNPFCRATIWWCIQRLRSQQYYRAMRRNP